ncbi:sulfurtransferase TusA family protein, partial [Staphylococcus sp. GDY8P199P]|uniref:sulfurtransferase TusA family protein n=1 Tax=Staphylococcus sp. GDY8P199P TaxID=2804175 RepID=UPI001AEC36F3
NFSKQELEKLGAQGQLIDVRTQEEYELAHINGATLHPVDKIESFNKDKNTTYFVHCKSGTRSAKASEYLAEQGYDIVNLDGGYKAYEAKNDDDNTLEENTNVAIKAERKQFNYSGLQCPGPIVNISKEVKNIEVGEQIEVTVTDPGFFSDIKSWVKQTGHTLVKLDESNNGINAIIQKEKPKDLEVNHTAKGTPIVLFSGE